MKNRLATMLARESGACIAVFGSAELRETDGEIYLEGGTRLERAEALEWMSLCLPERSVRLNHSQPAPCAGSWTLT